jgi:signal transduction histidine kinase/CheY-like chemotaxis protein
VEEAPAAIAMLGRDMRYLAVSRRWLSDYRLTGDIVGRSHYEVFSNCPERWKRIHEECLAGHVEHCDCDVWRPEGWSEDQYLRWEVRPWYLDDGSVGGILMFTEDITRLKRTEESLLTALTKAENANRTKSEFLANMSHEIRTPMTAILGYTELMLEDADLAGDELRREDALRTIRRNGEHLLGVINDILDISKIEAGRMTVESIPCSPTRIVEDLVLMMRPRAEAQGIDFSVHYEGALPPVMRSDPVRLRQILVNLVGNAIKFTSNGSVKLIVGYSASPRPELTFDVFDTGVGMYPEQVERIFSPFAQGDASTTRKFGGTGLGLAISRSLAKLLCSDVALVSSSPGVGSHFRLRVWGGLASSDSPMRPDSVAEQRVKSGISSYSHPLAGCQILLAEDGVDNQRLISYVLKRAGALLEIVDNGEKAVQAIEAARLEGRRIDIVLMDMQMPILDGYQATERLRAAGFAAPIIALTAHAMSDDREKCLAAGCTEYLSKPIDRRALVATLLRYYRPQEAAVPA